MPYLIGECEKWRKPSQLPEDSRKAAGLGTNPGLDSRAGRLMASRPAASAVRHAERWTNLSGSSSSGSSSGAGKKELRGEKRSRGDRGEKRGISGSLAGADERKKSKGGRMSSWGRRDERRIAPPPRRSRGRGCAFGEHVVKEASLDVLFKAILGIGFLGIDDFFDYRIAR